MTPFYLILAGLSFIPMAQAQVAMNTPAKTFSMAPPAEYDTGELPLFPEEKNLPNFPTALPEDQRSPENMEIYYNQVAATYEVVAEDFDKKIQAKVGQAAQHRATMSLNAARGFKDFGAVDQDPMARARMNTATYAGQQVSESHGKAQEARHKALFYRAMAEASREGKPMADVTAKVNETS